MVGIDYDAKKNVFIVEVPFNMNSIPSGMPDRRFNKRTNEWRAPALRLNAEYLQERREDNWSVTLAANEKLEQLCIVKDVVQTQTIPEWYQYETDPMKHQLECINKGIGLDHYAIFHEQGLGKTWSAINMAIVWMMQKQIEQVLVICPSSVQPVWEEQLEEHCPIPANYLAMRSGKYKQVTAFAEKGKQNSWLVMGIEALSQGKGYDYAMSYIKMRNTLVIVDESSRIKNANSLRTDKCIELGRWAKKRLILTGTPITQGMEDLFAQYRFLDPNIIGINNIYTFRNRYCIMGGYEGRIVLGYKNEDELLKAVAPYTHIAKKKDSLDLPEKTFQIRDVHMNPEQRRAYKELKEELCTEIDGTEIEVENSLEKSLRLAQITGGHYPFKEDEYKTVKQIPGKNPKIEEMRSLMSEIQGQIVIFCVFRPEVTAVASMLEAEGITYGEFHGGRTSDEKREAYRSFRAGNERILLCTKAAAYGLTLIEASTMIYFSVSYSYEDYSQSQDRIHRIGQYDPCLYIHLACPGTVDKLAIASLKMKENVANYISGSMQEGQASEEIMIQMQNATYDARMKFVEHLQGN